MRLLLLSMVLFAVTGCGKTLEQIKQSAHDLIDIAGKVYEDTKDNVDSVKKAIAPDRP